MEDSLEDHAIFVGLNRSFWLSATDFPGLRPNSIYVADDLTFGGHDLGIFNYKDETFEPCYYPCDCKTIKRIEP